MNRRGFLSVLGAIATTAVLDPERLLWVSGQRLISVPKPRISVNSLEVAGQTLFPVYRMDGGLASEYAYFMRTSENGIRVKTEEKRITLRDLHSRYPRCAIQRFAADLEMFHPSVPLALDRFGRVV